MRIKTIRLKKTFGFSEQNDREVKVAIIIISLFAAGMIVGAGISRIADSSVVSDEFLKIFDTFIKNRSELKTSAVFVNSVLADSIILFISFWFGMHCVGLPFITIIPIIRGMGFGMLSGFLIFNYKINGIGYYLLTVFPGGVLSVVIMILSCISAVILSCDYAAVIFGKKQSEPRKLIDYVKKHAVYLILLVFAGLINTVLSKSFSYLFVF